MRARRCQEGSYPATFTSLVTLDKTPRAAPAFAPLARVGYFSSVLVFIEISDFSWLYLGRMNVTIFGLILVALVLFLPDGLIVRLKEAGLLPKTRAL